MINSPSHLLSRVYQFELSIVWSLRKTRRKYHIERRMAEAQAFLPQDPFQDRLMTFPLAASHVVQGNSFSTLTLTPTPPPLGMFWREPRLRIQNNPLHHKVFLSLLPNARLPESSFPAVRMTSFLED